MTTFRSAMQDLQSCSKYELSVLESLGIISDGELTLRGERLKAEALTQEDLNSINKAAISNCRYVVPAIKPKSPLDCGDR